MGTYYGGRVYVVDHPYAHMVLTRIRDRGTGQIEFRKGLVKLGRLLGFEIVRTFNKVEKTVITPLGKEARGVEIPDIDNVILITVLRAAMPLTEGLLKVFPNAKQGVVSARRVEETYKGGLEFEIELNYVKIPEFHGHEVVIVADPMLATGSTMTRILEEVRKRGRPKRIVFATIISTKPAIERLLAADERAEIFTVAIDEGLNDRGFIVPGLGDAGDRAFG
ncbi:MAG: uracil phosphoribosyltransferase [Aigarchaeota archaeon]|nr:uracil phosphoribosyltransferase [Candidatus Pelearchaeum maunauluense]